MISNFSTVSVRVSPKTKWLIACGTSRRMQGVCLLTCALTGVRRVGSGAVEERGRASQVGHAGVVSVAVHGAANWGVAGLLRRGAGHVTVRWHAAAAAHETCRRGRGARGDWKLFSFSFLFISFCNKKGFCYVRFCQFSLMISQTTARVSFNDALMMISLQNVSF